MNQSALAQVYPNYANCALALPTALHRLLGVYGALSIGSYFRTDEKKQKPEKTCQMNDAITPCALGRCEKIKK
jgi:hypothetical protein